MDGEAATCGPLPGDSTAPAPGQVPGQIPGEIPGGISGQVPAPGPFPEGSPPPAPGSILGSVLGPGPFPSSGLFPPPGPDSGLWFPREPFPEDDFDLDAHFAWTIREIEEGREQVPPEPELEGPAVSLSLGDACDVDPVLLAGMCGPLGLGGQAVSAAFGQGAAADVLRPGPVLAALSAQAASGCGSLTDDELIGSLRAARRLAGLADYQQVLAVAEFARRRQAQYQGAAAKGRPAGCREGEFPGEELAMELTETTASTSARIEAALELTGRLPATLAAMAAGLVDLGKAAAIAARTRTLADPDAAYADEVLAAAAPGLRPDQLARKAAALELKLAPDAVKTRKELARQLGQRVEARREDSGNASLSGRELATADVIASKAHIDALAARLRESGLVDGTLDQLRALVLTDLTQGRDPLDRLTPRPAPRPAPQPAPSGRPDGSGPSTGQCPPGPAGGSGDNRRWGGPGRPSDSAPAAPFPAPVPALINLLVPAGTLLGWGTAPAQAGGWGLLDPDETRALVAAASSHPATRWCMTIAAPDGTALAHGCANGRHPWRGHGLGPPRRRRRGRGREGGRGPGPPSAGQATQLLALLQRLNLTLEPVARDSCDHQHAENRYALSRKLKHLLRARNQTCTAPACNTQATRCDIDHTVPYPDGPSCQCNLNPKCRRHHRTKQAPGWKTTQPAPGTTTWTTPAGRTHTTTATTYDL